MDVFFVFFISKHVKEAWNVNIISFITSNLLATKAGRKGGWNIYIILQAVVKYFSYNTVAKLHVFECISYAECSLETANFSSSLLHTAI